MTRDREMKALAERYPGYGWERNVGYGTPEHRAGASTAWASIRSTGAHLGQFMSF